MRWLASVAVWLLLAGCSVRHLAIDKLGDALASGGTVFASDEDPDLVGAALPFSLKLIESLLAERPHHRGLLRAAASGFTQYSFGWVDVRASELQGTDFAESQRLALRARRLYLRARDYGLRGLESSIPGISTSLRAAAVPALAPARREDVPLLYWTASAWALAIAGSKDDPETVADMPLVEALIGRADELDPDYGDGAIDGFFIAWDAAHDRTEAARRHFDRAVRLTRGQLASPYVTLAESVSVASQNREEFDSLLEKALAVDAAARPEWRVQNELAKRRAQWLATHADDYFLGEGEEEEEP